MRLPLPLFAGIAFIAISCNKNSQSTPTPIPNNKALVWIKNFGGSFNDFAYSVVQTPDNNYVMAGATRSVDGDVGGSRAGYDAWIARFDANGAKIWSKTYGGNNDDYIRSIINTTDGGFLVAGYSFLAN